MVPCARDWSSSTTKAVQIAKGKKSMLQQLRLVSHAMWQWIYSLNRGEWLMLLLVATLLGFMLLQGFGSRSRY